MLEEDVAMEDSSDRSWNGMAPRLRHRLRRGPLDLAEATRLLQQAPDEPLSETLIERLVEEAIRRAGRASGPLSHWHLWIGACEHGGGSKSITLQIAGIVGTDAAVAQVSRTVQTPSWAVVSVSSLDIGSTTVDSRASVTDCHLISGHTDSGDCVGVAWEVDTDSLSAEKIGDSSSTQLDQEEGKS